MTANKIKVVEFFSGIGSQNKALKNINAEFEIVGISEWDITAIIAYDLIHHGPSNWMEHKNITKEEIISFLLSNHLSLNGKNEVDEKSLKKISTEALQRIYASIIRTKNFSNIKNIDYKILSNVDMITYSFPCQDLSNMGNIHGYNQGIDKEAKNRSGLLWEVERILLETKHITNIMPKYLLMENVVSIDSKKHKKNFELWKNQLEILGYLNLDIKLNSFDFGIPQKRNRMFMLSVFEEKKENKEKIYNYFHKSLEEKKINVDALIKYLCLSDDFQQEKLLSVPNKTTSREKILNQNPVIIDNNGNISRNFVSTITTKQDRHPNSGNIYFNSDKNNFRFLTPRECFRLMGFDDKDFQILLDENFNLTSKYKMFTRDKLYKLAGNSIVVNVLESIFKVIFEIENKSHLN